MPAADSPVSSVDGADASAGSESTLDTDSTTDAGSSGRWSLLGVGGVVSLCCLFAAPAATGAAAGTVAGGATAALGGGLVRILVSAAAVGCLGVVLRLRADSPACSDSTDCDA
jgi:hypothetical protein